MTNEELRYSRIVDLVPTWVFVAFMLTACTPYTKNTYI